MTKHIQLKTMIFLRNTVLATLIVSLTIMLPAPAFAAPEETPAAEENTAGSENSESGSNTENNATYSPQTSGYTSQKFKSSNNSQFYQACGGTSSDTVKLKSSTSGGNTSLKKTYVLGDSITLRAERTGYEQKLKEAGAEEVKIVASAGGNLDSAGTDGVIKSGFQSLDDDKDYIKDATTVIIAHGTNNLKNGLSPADEKPIMEQAIKKVKDSGSQAKIFWVDVAITEGSGSGASPGTTGSYDDIAKNINKLIHSSTDLGYSVVSWAKVVDPSIDPANQTTAVKDDAHLLEDGIHPTVPAGIEKYIETVINGVKNGSPSTTPNSQSDSNGCCTDSASTVQLAGKDNIEKVLNFFMAKGLTLAQASGGVGNMMQESGVDPRKIQGGAIADENYQMQDGVGFGLIQWTFTGRQAPLKAKAEQMNKKVFEIEPQLEYIWDELNGAYKHSLEAIKKAENPVDAAVAFHGPPNPGYEASADSAEKVRSVRGGNAQKIYDQYKDAAPAGSMSTGSSGATTTAGSTTPSTEGSGGGKAVIALDPGHSVPEINDPEPETGATLSDYPNGAEVNDMWEVGQKVKEGLEKAGYTVKMLRGSKEEKVNFKDRAERAKGSAMAVSLHSTVGKSEVFYQFKGGKRTGPKATKTFENEEVAGKSKTYADAMAKARSEKEGSTVSTGKVNFDSRGGGIAPGDITWVQLLAADTPWVYNEFSSGGRGGAVALSAEDKVKYAEGVVAGVIAANPQGGDAGNTSSGCGDSSSTSGSGISGTAQKYAWKKSDPKAGSIDPKPEYAEAVKKAKSAGLYVGGISHPGIDCGGFVTLLLRDSGYETGYNENGKGGPTSAQEAWMKKNWQSIGSGPQDPAKLKAGDVAINASHTFVFVGDVGGDFGSNIASASLDERAPQAGGDDANESGFNWYRKK